MPRSAARRWAVSTSTGAKSMPDDVGAGPGRELGELSRPAGDVEPPLPLGRPDRLDDGSVHVRQGVGDVLERGVPPDEALPLLQILECHRPRV